LRRTPAAEIDRANAVVKIANWARCAFINLMSAQAQRFQHDYMVPNHPPKFGAQW